MRLTGFMTAYIDNFNYPLIINTEYPFLIAYPMLFKAGEEHPEVLGAKVNNYNIIMTYGGGLVKPNEIQDIQGFLEDAAAYYYNKVIISSPFKFKSFCEDKMAERERRADYKQNNRMIEKERKFRAVERKLFKQKESEE